MTDVKVAFKPLEDGDNVPIGHTFVPCNIIFDVKMEEFCRKSCPVASGHMPENPYSMTYSSVVYRDTVHLALVISSLNDLEVKCVDAINSYVTAPIEQKICKTLGPKFGPNTDKIALVFHALNGLKSTKASFRAHLGQYMQGLGNEPYIAHPNLWIKA